MALRQETCSDQGTGRRSSLKFPTCLVLERQEVSLKKNIRKAWKKCRKAQDKQEDDVFSSS